MRHRWTFQFISLLKKERDVRLLGAVVRKSTTNTELQPHSGDDKPTQQQNVSAAVGSDFCASV